MTLHRSNDRAIFELPHHKSDSPVVLLNSPLHLLKESAITRDGPDNIRRCT